MVRVRRGIRAFLRRLRPRRKLEGAGPRIVAQDHRAEQDRHRRGRRDRARDWKFAVVRAYQGKLCRLERELKTEGDLRCVDLQSRPVARMDVTEGLSFEQNLVVVLGCKVASVELGRTELAPRGWRENRSRQLSLDVSVEKLVGVVFEDSISEQAVVRGREAAAGHRRDGIDLIEQAKLATFPADSYLGHGLEDTIGERRGAGASPRECKPDEQGVRTSLARLGLRWAGANCDDWRVWLVDGIVRRAACKQ